MDYKSTSMYQFPRASKSRAMAKAQHYSPDNLTVKARRIRCSSLLQVFDQCRSLRNKTTKRLLLVPSQYPKPIVGARRFVIWANSQPPVGCIPGSASEPHRQELNLRVILVAHNTPAAAGALFLIRKPYHALVTGWPNFLASRSSITLIVTAGSLYHFQRAGLAWPR